MMNKIPTAIYYPKPLHLQNAFKKKLLINTFQDENYFNIKRMQSIKLK